MGTAQPEPCGVPAALEAMGVATRGAPSQPVQPKRPAHPNGQPGRALFLPTEAALAGWTAQACEQRAENVFD